MASRTPREALTTYVDLLRETLSCITRYRLTLTEFKAHRLLPIDRDLSVALNDLEPVRLAGEFPIMLLAGQRFRIAELAPGSGGYRAITTAYFYAFTTLDQTELLVFQWNPSALGGAPFPHLHVGVALLAEATPVRPSDFTKVHVPTGHVSPEAVVRLAIEEFRVKPLRRGWQRILQRAEATAGHPVT